MRQNAPTSCLYGGIFLLTCGTLLFELSLIRLFSVALWYHFAFLVVSIAMLGLGAAGSFLTIFQKWLPRISLSQLSNLALCFSITVVLAYLITNQIPFDQKKIAWDGFQLLYLLLYYFILAVPPFFTGLILSTVYTNYSQQIGKFYFFDISGAAIGSLVVLFVSALADGLGGLATAVCCGLASSCFFKPRWSTIFSRLLFFTMTIVILISRPAILSLNLSEYKALPQLLRPANAKILHTEWTPLARFDFVQSPMVHFAPGLSLLSYSSLPEQIGVVVDGGNLNAVTKFNGNPASLAFVNQLPSALPYHLSEVSSVLVCEPLGGLEFLTALHFAVSEIEGAGIYNQVGKITEDRFREFSGGLFGGFGINLHDLAPRSYLKQTAKKYDLICLPITDSFGAAGTGIYGPAEEYLFTIDSFTEMMNHLSNGGWLISSSYILPPLRQELRLISLVVGALENSKQQPLQQHILAIRTLETFSILVKASPVNQAEVRILRDFCESRGFDLVYYPGITTQELNRFNRFDQPIFHKALMAILSDSTRTSFFEDYVFDVSPTTDDRPFFGHFFRKDKISEEYESLGRKWNAFFAGGYLVAALFAQACFLSLIFIVSPLLFQKKRSQLKTTKLDKMPMLGYFFCIGLAYMLIEIVLIQRFILVLEHPLYAASAVIASLLVSSACGSYISNKVSQISQWSIPKHLTLLCLVLFLYVIFLARIVNVVMGEALFVRYLISVIIIAIPGFLMGFPFPVGIRALGQIHERLIPWAYCANGSASVISASLAVLIALEWGFSWVMMIAVGFYFFAAVAGLRWLGWKS